MLATDLLQLDVSMPSQSFARCGLLASVLGMARSGFVSLLSVLDFAQPSSSIPTRSSAHLKSSSLAIDLLHLSSTTLLRSLAQLEVSFPICGIARTGSLLPTPDTAHLGFMLLPQSFTRSGVITLVPDLLQLDTALFLRSSA